jgi:hypothetical protein
MCTRSDLWLTLALVGSLSSCTGSDSDEGATSVPPSQRSWSAPELLVDAEIAYTVQVAADSRGDAVVAWDQLDGKLKAKVYDAASGTWSETTLLEREDSTDDDVVPNVAMDGKGNAVVVWHRQSDALDNLSIWTNRYDKASRAWGVAEQIAGSELGLVPRLGVDELGNSLVVFSQFDLSGVAVVATARAKADSRIWSSTETLTRMPERHSGGPELAMEPGGDAVVAWTTRMADLIMVWAARYRASDGTWSTPRQLSPEVGYAQAGGVAINEHGAAVVTWMQAESAEAEEFAVWSSRSDAIGTDWSTPQRIDLAGSGLALLPEVAIDAAGNATAVWSSDDGTRQSAWTNRYSVATGGWQAAERLEADDEADAIVVRLGVDGDGNALAIWTRDDDVRKLPWVRWYDASKAAWGSAEPLHSEGTGDSTLGQVAVMPDGRAIAVWSNDVKHIFVSHCGW